MLHRLLPFLILTCLFLSASTPPTPRAQAQGGPRFPFPQHVLYAPDTIKPNHRSQAQLDADVQASYDHWKAHYLVPAGTTTAGDPLYRISWGELGPEQTVSEGQGYGMMIVALMAGYDADAQIIFDGLWEFSREHPSEIDPRLMDWKVPESIDDDDSAFDGDADIAYGLLLADAQWGSEGGIDYRTAAEMVITAIDESTIGPDSRLPMLGDWVPFSDPPYTQYTHRTSDFMPSHFRAYGRATNNSDWQVVVAKAQSVIDSFQANHSPTTGLLPDFVIGTDGVPQPAFAGFLEGGQDGQYAYNAGRIPWRIGLDVLLNDDPTSRSQVQMMSRWLEIETGGQVINIKAGYALDGTPLSDYFTTFFAAPFGVAAMSDPTQQVWLNDIYDAVYDTHEDYYEDSVTLLSLLAMTGNFWDPTAITSVKQRLFLPLILKKSADLVTPTPTMILTATPTSTVTIIPTATATDTPTATPTHTPTAASPPDNDRWQPTPGTRWWWQLEQVATLDTTLDVDVYDIDLFEGDSSGVIQILKSNGYGVICYFSAGTYEPYRQDMQNFNEAAWLEPVDGFEEERWLDIRQNQPYLEDDIKPVMMARINLAAEAGCDAVEPDNVDAWENTAVISAADQVAYNLWLAETAHAVGLSIGLKNNLSQVSQLVNAFDFALNEQCFGYNECDLYEDTFLAQNKAVFNQEYGGSDEGSINQAQYHNQACPYFQNRRISSLWKFNFDLDGQNVIQCQP